MVTQRDPNQNNQNLKKSNTQKRKKRKDWSFYVIIISLIIIAIPASFLGYHIIGASLQTGKPIFGDRFKGDLSLKIEEAKLTELEELVKSNESVQSVDFTLVSATLRANVLVKPEIAKESYQALSESIYTSVDSLLPISEYFTKTASEKMYDLEINLFNTLKPSDDNPFIYFLLNKSSSNEEPTKQLMSESSYPDFLESLIDSQTAKDTDQDKDAATDS